MHVYNVCACVWCVCVWCVCVVCVCVVCVCVVCVCGVFLVHVFVFGGPPVVSPIRVKEGGSAMHDGSTRDTLFIIINNT